MPNQDFWQALDTLVQSSQFIIDRPCGSAHPRYPEFIYPLDYGYLQGTTSPDGHGIDVWVGSQDTRQVTALIVAVDLQKRDSEMKILLGCTSEECQLLLAIHNEGLQSATLLERPVLREEASL